MPRRALWLAALALVGPAFTSPADDDPRTVLKYVQGLRDQRHYYDLAVETLERLRSGADVPADIKGLVDYELGRTYLDEASVAPQLERRRELLDLARGRLDAFLKASPDHAKATEALVQSAKLLIERGHLAVLQADEARTPAEKQAKLGEARTAFARSREAYDRANKILAAAYNAFPKFIPDDDRKKQEARNEALVEMIQGELQRAVVDYEEAETYPEDSAQRKEWLEKARPAFEELYKRHRTQFAGFSARMWQAKCYEEQGKLGEAMGIYDELMDHPDPRLRPIQRKVGYFKILVMGKRKEFALAADECVRWLQANPAERRSPEGLAVQYEKARNILAQVPELKTNDRDAAVKIAVDSLAEVVRYVSPFKGEALKLLREHKPRTAVVASAIAALNYEQATAEADEAISGEEWDRAIALLRHAVRKAEQVKDRDKVNAARYLLAFAYYKDKAYYEADVVAEHLARRYPQGPMSAKAAEIGMASLASAYDAFARVDRVRDLNRLAALTAYTIETWPDSDPADTARLVLGEISLGRGQYAEAAAAYETVRSSSAKWPEAQAKAGAAHWKQGLVLRSQTPPKPSEADAEAAKAVAALKLGLKGRQDAGAAPVDAGLVGNACDLADVYLETEKPADALSLLTPMARAVLAINDRPADFAPLLSRLISGVLRAHIAVGQVDAALGDMKILEQAGGGANLTQLYFKLGELLKKEMDARKAKNDTLGLRNVQAAYLKFLDALAASQSNQTYESLQWAGESMLSIERYKPAIAVFDRILKKYEDDSAFNSRPNASDRLLRTKLRRISALRGDGDFDQAVADLDALMKDHRDKIEPRIEQCLLIESKAAAKKGTWDQAINAWQKLGLQLRSESRKRPEYYESWYHVAYALWKKGDPAKAKQTLSSIMRLAPTVGSPEMKAKYEDLLKQIGS